MAVKTCLMEEPADSQVGKDFVDPQKPVTADLVAHEKEVQACPMIMAKVKRSIKQILLSIHP